MTIGKRLTLSFAAMVIVTLILGITSLNSVGKLSQALDIAVNKTTKKIILSDTIRTARSDMLAGQRGVIMFTYAESPKGGGGRSSTIRVVRPTLG
jgi:CHASE3 domain sensor protein